MIKIIHYRPMLLHLKTNIKIGEECSTYGRHKTCVQFLFRKPKGSYISVRCRSRSEYNNNIKMDFNEKTYEGYLAQDGVL